TIHSDPIVIDRWFGAADPDTRAIITGHGHYDHLLDVPYVWSKTPSAMIYGNIASQHLLAGLAPDRPMSCPAAQPAETGIPRDKIVAVDDPANDRVVYRLCATQQGRCPAAYDGRPGEWIAVPNSHVRLRGLCSSHPPQFLFVHFGLGCVDADVCTPP